MHYAEGTGHPPVHVQFYGVLNDIPRIPVFIFTPADVIDFTLMELFQKRWRERVLDAKVKSILRGFPTAQSGRAVKVFAGWQANIKSAPNVRAYMALQHALPLDLS